MSDVVKISILMPFRNAASTLSRSIDSIRYQTFHDFEMILINDGSVDDGKAIVQQYKDPRIRLYDLPPSGIVAALNKGISEANGEFIARMDADDYAHPDRLEKQLRFLTEHPEIDVLGTRVRYLGDQFTNAGFYHYNEWNNQILSHDQIFKNRFVESPLVHPSVMARTSVIKKHGGYLEGPFPEDYELWLRLLHEGVHFHKLDETLLDWHDLPDRLSRTEGRYGTDAFFRLKTNYLVKWLKAYFKNIPPVLIWGTGKSVYSKSKWLDFYQIDISGYVDVQEKKYAFRGKPVIDYQDISKDYLILSYVSDRIGRVRIHEYLLTNGFLEGYDFFMMA
jgi:glycosyltransferase involved in cell wall biosynthesis